MLQFDLENERQTLINYRQRIRQADAMGEFALGEVLREIIAQEQEHLQDLADASWHRYAEDRRLIPVSEHPKVPDLSTVELQAIELRSQIIAFRFLFVLDLRGP